MDLRPFTVAGQHRTCTCFPFHLSLYAARETPADAIHFHPLYYNRSRKKTPWITRDFSGSSPLFLCGLLRCFALSKVFPAQHLHDTSKSSCDRPVILRSVRDHAFCAVLVSLFCVPEVTAALFSQCIERAITEQAVESVRLLRLVAREILAFPVLEKCVMFPFPIRFSYAHFRSFLLSSAAPHPVLALPLQAFKCRSVPPRSSSHIVNAVKQIGNPLNSCLIEVVGHKRGYQKKRNPSYFFSWAQQHVYSEKDK